MVILITFTLDRIIYLVMSRLSDRIYTGDSIGKLNSYLKRKDTLDFIVYGNSRSYHHVDPAAFTSKGYAMGMDGRQIAFCAALIKGLPKNKKQLVALHIDPIDVYNEAYIGNDIDALKSKYNRNTIIKNEIDNLNQATIFQRIFWSISYNNTVFSILKNSIQPNATISTGIGYMPAKSQKYDADRFAKIRKNKKGYTTCKEPLVENKITNDYFDELRDFCEANQKTLIIFTAPMFDDPCKNDNLSLAKVLQTKGIRYYDFTDVIPDSALELWTNEIYLSQKGAEQFTSLFRQSLIEDGFWEVE